MSIKRKLAVFGLCLGAWVALTGFKLTGPQFSYTEITNTTNTAIGSGAMHEAIIVFGSSGVDTVTVRVWLENGNYRLTREVLQAAGQLEMHFVTKIESLMVQQTAGGHTSVYYRL